MIYEMVRLAMGVPPPIEAYADAGELPSYIVRVGDNARFNYDGRRRWYYHEKTGEAFNMWDLDEVLHESDPNPEVRFFLLSDEKVHLDGTPVKPLPLAA